jgi:hypothetical protein
LQSKLLHCNLIFHADQLCGHYHGLPNGLGCQCQFPELGHHFVITAEIPTDKSVAEGGKWHSVLQLVPIVPSHFLLHLQLPFSVGIVAYGC